MLKLPTLRFVLFIFVLGGVPAEAAHAQDIIGNTGREELTRPSSGPGRIKQSARKVNSAHNAHPTVTTGTLSVAALPKATILVERMNGGGDAEGTVPPGERLFIFANLKPGNYHVSATLDGYKQDEQDVEIVANRHKGVTLNLQPMLYRIIISANVASGEVRYAPVETYIEPGTTEKRYRRSGETRVLPIENHQAVLPALPKGIYGVDIRAGEVGFETKLGTVTVPDETDKEELKLNVTLKNVRSTETFALLTNDQWDLPAGWTVASYLLSTKGKGVALPRVESYRHYTDFHLISDVKMVNGVSVSFVARAADKENYYLIQLTGPNAEEPYLLSGFIVKHGVPQRFQSIPIGHVKATIKPNQFFLVSIKMKDNNIDVRLHDSQTGEDVPLGILVDPDRNFTIGATGIAGGEHDRSQFGSFMVCYPECPKH